MEFVYEWRWALIAVGVLWAFGALIAYSCCVVAGRADDVMEEAMRRRQEDPLEKDPTLGI